MCSPPDLRGSGSTAAVVSAGEDTERRRGRQGACYNYKVADVLLPFCRFEYICSVYGGETTIRQHAKREGMSSGTKADAPAMSNH